MRRRIAAATHQTVAENVRRLLGSADEETSEALPLHAQADPGRRALFAGGVIACVVAVLCLWWALSGHPQSEALPAPEISGASAPSTPTSVPDTSGVSPTPGTVVVDVTGKVHHPGVYVLPVGSRVQAALSAAGGAKAGVDLSAINLARELADGEQIAVGVTGAGASAPPRTGGGASGGGSASDGGFASDGGVAGAPPVNLNTADATELDALPGVGPATAQRILDWRSAHGRYESVEQLREVSGIGPAKYAQLKDRVTV